MGIMKTKSFKLNQQKKKILLFTSANTFRLAQINNIANAFVHKIAFFVKML